MTGRNAFFILNGGAGRHVARAVRDVLAKHQAVARAVAVCAQCNGALRFSSDSTTGRALEHCDRCGRTEVIARRTPAEMFDEAVPIEMVVRRCARCQSELPAGRAGTRRARFCRNRRVCLRASVGKTETPAPVRLDDDEVLAKLPDTSAAARRLQDVAAELLDFSTDQVRRVLVRLVHRGRVRTTLQPLHRPQGGRPPLRYWRAA